MDQPIRIRSEGCRVLALALLASFMMTFCSVMGVTAGYLLWQVVENPNSLGLYGDLVDPVEASGHLPAVGPHFGSERPGLMTVSSVQSGRRTNILLLGLDQRGELQHRAVRTDTIMIASLDLETKHAVLFSIPRDLYVEVPENGKRRINIVHVLGETQGYPGGGPALLMDTIRQDFGIPLDGYVMVNFQGFREIVDVLGGADIYVEKEILDSKYPDDRGGEATIHIPAGQQQMDSDTLLQYCRSRYSTDDFDRAARQQKALLALARKFLSLQMFPRLPQLLQTMGHTVYTDLEPEEIVRLVQIASQVDPGQARSVVIDRSLLDPSQRQPGDEPDLLYPDWEKIHALIDEMFSE
jgi:LCP family protein required for cell wall assembly